MKIDREQYLFLNRLEKRQGLFKSKKGKYGFAVAQDIAQKLDRRGDFYDRTFRTICSKVRFNGTVRYVCPKIVEHIEKQSDIINNIYCFKEKIDPESGLLLLPNGLSFLYDISYNSENELKVEVFKSLGHTLTSFTRVFPNFNIEALGIDGNVSFYSDTFPYDCSAPIFVLAMLVFLKIVEHKVKTTDNDSDNKTHISKGHEGAKGGIAIEAIDSTWFTTTIRSKVFTVNGFFRYQVYGKGRKLRKKIWINPFVKSGYTRKAKMLNTKNRNNEN